MAGQSDSEIISAYPIWEGLNVFRDTFKATCEGLAIPNVPQSLERLSNEGKHTPSLVIVLYLTDMQNSKS